MKRNFLSAAMCGICLAVLVLAGCEDDGSSSPDFGENDGDLYVALGDSITAGEFIGSSSAYPARLSSLLGKTVINEGRSGETSASGLRRIDGILANRKPGYILILYGANDIIRGGSSSTTEHLRNMIVLAKDNNTVPVIATLTPAFHSHSYMQDSIVALNEQIRALGSQEHVKVVDLESAFNWDDSYFLDDGLHPNNSGAQLIADTFNRAL